MSTAIRESARDLWTYDVTNEDIKITLLVDWMPNESTSGWVPGCIEFSQETYIPEKSYKRVCIPNRLGSELLVAGIYVHM